MFCGWSHPMHIGGSSPFNKKEWVIKEWPECGRAIAVSSYLFVREQSLLNKFICWSKLCHLIGSALYNVKWEFVRWQSCKQRHNQLTALVSETIKVIIKLGMVMPGTNTCAYTTSTHTHGHHGFVYVNILVTLKWEFDI